MQVLKSRRQRVMNATTLSEILRTVRVMENKGKEPTFNAILYELSAKGVLEFHRTLRRYLDLLMLARVLSVTREKSVQPNIREKQVYHAISRQPIIEAGEKALLFHGLNWQISSPMPLTVETDLQGLSRSTISNGTLFASVEDSIVECLHVLVRRYPKRASELTVFATALLATERVDYDYLLRRAKKKGMKNQVIEILIAIDNALTSSHPDVEDVRTLFGLRARYSHFRRNLIKSLQRFGRKEMGQGIKEDLISTNEVVEYAGKQLGIRG